MSAPDPLALIFREAVRARKAPPGTSMMMLVRSDGARICASHAGRTSSTQAPRPAHFDSEEEYCSAFRDAADEALRLLFPRPEPRVPFRIGLRHPRRLQIARAS